MADAAVFTMYVYSNAFNYAFLYILVSFSISLPVGIFSISLPVASCFSQIPAGTMTSRFVSSAGVMDTRRINVMFSDLVCLCFVCFSLGWEGVLV